MNNARELLQKTELPETASGDWAIERFEVSETDAERFNTIDLSL